ncbi:MAG: response regulator [Magnetococcales bacterium]|nr:response regulator [Magnetococcales bacterium]NGZ07079.1 response regulator [Magnetococcales bacterium]
MIQHDAMISNPAPKNGTLTHPYNNNQNYFNVDSFSRSFIDYSIDAVIIADLCGRIIEFNRSSEKLFGFIREDCIGKDIGDLLIPSEYGSMHKRGLEHLRNQENLMPKFLKRFNSVAVCSGGFHIQVEISLFLVKIDQEIYGVASIRDATAFQQLVRALNDTLLVAEQNTESKNNELERIKRSEKNATIALQTQQTVNHILHLSLKDCSLQEKLQMALDFIGKLPWLLHGENWLGIYLSNKHDNIFELLADCPEGKFPKQYCCEYASNDCSLCIHSLHTNPLLSVFVSPGNRFIEAEIENKFDYCIPLISNSENIGIFRMVVDETIMQGAFHNLMFDSIGKVLVNLVIRSHVDQALKESQERAEIANNAKSQFLANMSHEIRTPLNVIIGMTDLVLNTPLSREEMFGNLEIVRSSSLSLLELINGILDLSKIEAGHFQLESTPFDLLGQLEGACEMLAIKAHQKGLSLYTRIPMDLPRTLMGDPLRLKQIIINLINNAIKFTNAGEIVLTVEHDALCDPHNGPEFRVRFSVRDTGIGIPENQQQQIFQSFVQADGSIARKFGGTGLGLTISRHLVEMMGGKLQVISREGHGSCFHFSLPLAIAKEQPEQEPWMKPRRSDHAADTSAPLQERRILLADTHPTGGEIIENLLCFHGAIVTYVNNCADLQEQMDQNVHHPFDLVVVDETIKQRVSGLEQDPYLYYQSRILVLVSPYLTSKQFVLDGLFQKAVLIKKPVRQFYLLKKIQQLLTQPTGQTAEDPAIAINPLLSKSLQPLEILLVEDLPGNQKLAQDILVYQGHRVMIANNGVDALETLKRGAHFDLILMDLQMPVMDGFETTRRIRNGDPSEVGNPHVPIVAVSAMVMMNERQKCYEIGMNGFLLKPYQPHELVEMVSGFSKINTPPVRKPVKPVKPVSEIVLSGVEIDAETLRRFRQNFIVEAPNHLFKLHQSLQQTDLGSVVLECNWLRNMAEHIGANRLASHAIRLIGQVEMDAWEDAQSMYPNLEQYVEALVQHLAQEGVA